MKIAAPLTSEPTPALQRIEVATSLQIPSFYLIGLAGPEVSEARERVRAAIDASGFEFPRRRVVINLSPANVRKRGTGLDLAMAIGVLAVEAKAEDSGLVVAWGELGLDGSVKPADQPTRALYAAWKSGARCFLFSADEKAQVLEALDLIGRSGELTDFPAPLLYPVSTLREAWNAVAGSLPSLSCQKNHSASQKPPHSFSHLLPLAPILERTVTIAATGRHHVLITGAKGMGKSHALDWLIALQPRASAAFDLHHRLIRELSPLQGSATSRHLSSFRRVGAHVRPAALIGSVGAGLIRPGEFSLAHGGLLIADEFPEWPRDSREALREPLERGAILLTRADASLELPARFVLAANGNLCPCGGFPGLCFCSHEMRKDYVDHLSGPLLDRIDMAVKIDNEPKAPLRKEASFEKLRDEVESARERAVRRWGMPAGSLDGSAIEEILKENPSWNQKVAGYRLSSLRSRHKMIRIALSLAAWDGQDQPSAETFAEAARYRPENVDFLSRKEA